MALVREVGASELNAASRTFPDLWGWHLGIFQLFAFSIYGSRRNRRRLQIKARCTSRQSQSRLQSCLERLRKVELRK